MRRDCLGPQRASPDCPRCPPPLGLSPIILGFWAGGCYVIIATFNATFQLWLRTSHNQSYLVGSFLVYRSLQAKVADCTLMPGSALRHSVAVRGRTLLQAQFAHSPGMLNPTSPPACEQ